MPEDPTLTILLKQIHDEQQNIKSSLISHTRKISTELKEQSNEIHAIRENQIRTEERQGQLLEIREDVKGNSRKMESVEDTVDKINAWVLQKKEEEEKKKNSIRNIFENTFSNIIWAFLLVLTPILIVGITHYIDTLKEGIRIQEKIDTIQEGIENSQP